ncbi:MAG: four helix bundle protein [Candidatus Marinimicrobia bacterium]|nr:four helix bundle protein [Candidatus Neomarinimicrobiota bacterium]
MTYLLNSKKNILANKSFSYAMRIVNLYKFLINDKKEYVMSKQLLRSGTAIGALITEAQNAESKKDFIHKLGIAQKECAESIFWLNLLVQSKYLKDSQFNSIEVDTQELLKILRSSIITAKKNL